MSEWIEEVIKEIERIKNWEVKDRLSLMAKITFMNESIASSVVGWQHRLGNALTIENFTEEELREIEKGFQAIVLAFLDFDMKCTQILEEKMKKKESKKKEDSKKKTPSYVA